MRVLVTGGAGYIGSHTCVELSAFWADSRRAFELINWMPKHGIDKMCKDTWRWQNKNINGY
jgi:UDP-glucose 4-epimerase